MNEQQDTSSETALRLLLGLASFPTVEELEVAVLALDGLADSGIGMDLVVRSSTSEYEPLRIAAAKALPSFVVNVYTATGLAALIELSRDTSEEVRNWSTFGLACILAFPSDEAVEFEQPRIAQVLMDRLIDTSSVVRGEAIRGLVLRHWPNARAAVQIEILGDDILYSPILRAIGELGDPDLAGEALPRMAPGTDPKLVAELIALSESRKVQSDEL